MLNISLNFFTKYYVYVYSIQKKYKNLVVHKRDFINVYPKQYILIARESYEFEFVTRNYKYKF